MRAALVAVVASLAACGGATAGRPAAAPVHPALAADPVVDPVHPPEMRAVRVPSGDVAMNGVVYLASGAGPHPTALLLHGLPGNEQSLDLAQAIRRAGWNVLTLHYRGSWGSPGTFSLAGALDDARAAIAYLREPGVARELRVDRARLVVLGHSMGGFLAAAVAAEDRALLGAGLIAAANYGPRAVRWAALAGAARAELERDLLPDTVPLAGYPPAAWIDEVVARGAGWDLVGYAAGLRGRPVLVVTVDDGNAPDTAPLAAALGRATTTARHLAADHALSGHRIALAAEVLAWLDRVARRPAL